MIEVDADLSLDLSLDAPIPSRETIYVWDAVEECWVTWVQWVFAEAHRNAGTVERQVEAPRAPAAGYAVSRAEDAM